MSAVIKYRNVCKVYNLGETKIHALRDVSFSIEQRDFAAIVGPSGSGKSTLLHLGAAMDNPTQGRVELLGNDLAACSPRELSLLRNQTIGFIFQSFNLIPVLSVLENIEYPCLFYPEARKNRSRAAQLLKDVGMHDQAKKRPGQLSGGQRQRVAIARALVNNPKIVFADEPTANLDHETGGQIMQLMEDLNRSYGTTFLFSTHDDTVMQKAHRIIKIEDGRLFV